MAIAAPPHPPSPCFSSLVLLSRHTAPQAHTERRAELDRMATGYSTSAGKDFTPSVPLPRTKSAAEVLADLMHPPKPAAARWTGLEYSREERLGIATAAIKVGGLVGPVEPDAPPAPPPEPEPTVADVMKESHPELAWDAAHDGPRTLHLF